MPLRVSGAAADGSAVTQLVGTGTGVGVGADDEAEDAGVVGYSAVLDGAEVGSVRVG